MAQTDSLGLPVSTQSPEALAAFEQGVGLWLRWRSGSLEALNDAVELDPEFTLAHCVRSYFAWRMGRYDVAMSAHQQAMDRADNVYDEREQYHLRIADAMKRGGGDEAYQLLEELADDYPADRIALRLLSFNYLARGDYRKALSIFERANSLERYPHLLWHLAEAHAILGDERLTQDYWASTAPALPLFERIELQWRREILRHTPVDMDTWDALSAQADQLLEHGDYLTIWMHHWIGLAFARAGKTAKAQQQLARLRSLPEGRPSGHWSTQGADLLEGEIALIQGDFATAAQWMMPAVHRLHDMGGGSREQKDIFQDVCLEVHRRIGDTDAVMELAERRLQRNPNHLQSLATLAWAYGENGQATQQHQTYHDLINRAETGPIHDQTPALIEARQAIQMT